MNGIFRLIKKKGNSRTVTLKLYEDIYRNIFPTVNPM